MTYKILNYNLWNSFHKLGLLKIDFLEPLERRLRRFAYQCELLRRFDPDLLLLQELSPYRSLIPELQKIFHYHENHQADQDGIKIRGLGLPYNFSNGIASFSKPAFALKKLKSLRLSGSKLGFNYDWLSMQTEEFRYALFSEVQLPGLGRILLINMHLHHGIEWSPDFDLGLQKLLTDRKILQSEYEGICEDVVLGNKRKHAELQKVFHEFEKNRLDFDHVIWGGDWNITAGSSVLNIIGESDLIDPVAILGEKDLYTWDPLTNSENFNFSRNLEPPVKNASNRHLREYIQTYDSRRRRIDHVFVSNSLQNYISKVSLFGKEKELGFSPSDHYGLIVEFKV